MHSRKKMIIAVLHVVLERAQMITVQRLISP
jgi:hypothetical protein